MAATDPSSVPGYVASWEPPGVRPLFGTTQGNTIDVTSWEERAAGAGNSLAVNGTKAATRAHLGVPGLGCTGQFNSGTSLFTGVGSSYFNNSTTAQVVNTNMTIGVVASKSMMQKAVGDSTKAVFTVQPFFAGFPAANVCIGTNSNGQVNAFTADSGVAANVLSLQLWKQSADVVWIRTTVSGITINSYGMAAGGTTAAANILAGAAAGGMYIGSNTGTAEPWYGTGLGVYWFTGNRTDQQISDMGEWMAARYPLPTLAPTTLVAFVGDSYGGFGASQTMFEAAAHATRDFAWCYNRCIGGAEAADIDSLITASLASITGQPSLPASIVRKIAYIAVGHNAILNITGSPPTVAAWKASMLSIANKCRAAGWIPVLVYPTMVNLAAWAGGNFSTALTYCNDLHTACNELYAARAYTYRVRANRMPWDTFAAPNGSTFAGYSAADTGLIALGTTNFRLGSTATANVLTATGNDGIHKGPLGHQITGGMLAQSIEAVVSQQIAAGSAGSGAPMVFFMDG